MELTIKDRLYIPAFLPKEGTFKDFNLKKEVLRKIGIPDDERKALNLREEAETKRIEWDVENEQPLHVSFSEDEMEYLRASCERLCDEKLPDDMWASVEKIYNTMQQD